MHDFVPEHSHSMASAYEFVPEHSMASTYVPRCYFRIFYRRHELHILIILINIVENLNRIVITQL